LKKDFDFGDNLEWTNKGVTAVKIYEGTLFLNHYN